MSVKPTNRPASGDSTSAWSARTTPLEVNRPQRASVGELPSATRWHQTAPTMPPISACDELDGMPQYQVSKFQLIAPSSAAAMTV